MNALIKKEIRLLLPSTVAAIALAAVQAITRPYDFYIVSLVFLGMAIMALTVIGRETSLNTFSGMLSQPMERAKLWKVKLSVLVVAFGLVLTVWLAAFGIAWFNSGSGREDGTGSYELFVTICLVAMATFTGGLWTTLLLRQLAAAFWLTLLVPALLSGFSAAALATSESESLVIAVLTVVIGVYSLAGFLFARWLFFRAQDVGWSGGVIVLPEWRLFTRGETAMEIRAREPAFALLKKELQLQQGVLTGAALLFVLHTAIVLLRVFHQFAKDSAGDVLTNIFWILWFLVPVLLGSLAVAEERKLGVMESQLCLPVSRRVQFTFKLLTVLVLGVFFGGILPLGMELLGAEMGTHNSIFSPLPKGMSLLTPFLISVPASVALTLVPFYASSLTKSFLTAIGTAFLSFPVLMFSIAFTNHHTIFYDRIAPNSMLPFLIAVPTLTVALVWLAYLNFRNFREGWPLWRRQLLGALCAVAFIGGGSAALYHRAWEIFEPAEPAHGPARLSLANPPQLRNESFENLLVRLPDGRVWFDFLAYRGGFGQSSDSWRSWFWRFFNPMPESAGPRKFISGSDWVDASARHVDEVDVGPNDPQTRIWVHGYADSVGIQPDGTLWASDKSKQDQWTAQVLTQFGKDSNWKALARDYRIGFVVLLKKDGTLWRWGTNHVDYPDWPTNWPGLRAFQPYQIDRGSDWKALYLLNGILAQKADGTVWRVGINQKNGQDLLIREANYDDIVTQNFTSGGLSYQGGSYVANDGTLWAYGDIYGAGSNSPTFKKWQLSAETNWVKVAGTWDWLMAIKSGGTLWQCERDVDRPAVFGALTPFSVHRDWLAVAAVEGGIVSLAADGSLWLWPDRHYYEYNLLCIRLPKQPEYIGNVFENGK